MVLGVQGYSSTVSPRNPSAETFLCKPKTLKSGTNSKNNTQNKRKTPPNKKTAKDKTNGACQERVRSVSGNRACQGRVRSVSGARFRTRRLFAHSAWTPMVRHWAWWADACRHAIWPSGPVGRSSTWLLYDFLRPHVTGDSTSIS